MSAPRCPHVIGPCPSEADYGADCAVLRGCPGRRRRVRSLAWHSGLRDAGRPGLWSATTGPSPRATRSATPRDRAGKRGHLSIVHAYAGTTTETSAEALLEAILLEGDDELLDTRYSTYAVHGGAAEALIAAAERDRADEIVIGTRGRGRLESALLGSVGQAVIRDADRPVVVVPYP